MPNTIPAAITIPDPNAVGTGQVLRADTHEHVLVTTNWAHSEGHAGNVFMQEWADSLFAWNGAQTQVCEWRIPVISTAHTDVSISVEYTVSAGGSATIYARSVLGAGAVNTGALGAGTAWVTLPNLAIGTGTTYEDIQLDVAAAAGNITILRIVARYVVLVPARPGALPASTATEPVGGETVTPYGTAYYNADETMPAYTGRTLVNGWRHLLNRQRSYACWSGLDGITAFSPNARLGLTLNDHINAAAVSRGTDDQGKEFTLWAKVVPDVADDQVLSFDLWFRGEFQSQARLLVAAGAAVPAWKSLTWRMPEEQTIERFPYAGVRYRVRMSSAVAPVERNGNVYAYSIFGV